MLSYTVLLHNTLLLPLRRHGCVRRFAVRSAEAVEEGRPVVQPYGTAPLPDIKAAKRVVLVRHGQSSWNAEGRIKGSSDFAVLTEKGEAQAETSRQMLIDLSGDNKVLSCVFLSHQSQKTAELLLDLKVSSIISSPKSTCTEAASVIYRVQEAADCPGADCVPYVDTKELQELNVRDILCQSKKARPKNDKCLF
ncbi:hypothetical protein SAY87_013698 [Trapa incisa]|uniref:Uncharacterized protein n=1 Tax=Trapa incisa TaxID=236973 RepID=A0AAN7KJW1_9MYRT|nr:hypothetical protein SAY87_013698 [Trapa incisa]